MITVEAIGRLVADSVIKSFNDGSRYITFRVACEDPTLRNQDNTNKVNYISVSSTQPQHILMQKYLVKGKPVFIRGLDRSKAYIDKNTQMPMVGYNMKATDLYLLPSDSSVSQPQMTGVVPPQQTMMQQPAMQPAQGGYGVPQQQIAVNPVQAQQMQAYGQVPQQQVVQQQVYQAPAYLNDPDDNLPF